MGMRMKKRIRLRMRTLRGQILDSDLHDPNE